MINNTDNTKKHLNNSKNYKLNEKKGGKKGEIKCNYKPRATKKVRRFLRKKLNQQIKQDRETYRAIFRRGAEMIKASETETVIKKIVPYLTRRGYDLDKDLFFEEPTHLDTEERKGFIDILVKCGQKNAYFLIEAKRDGTKIIAKHRKQAISYGKTIKCLFVAVSNGQLFELLNTTTSKPLKLNGSAFNRLPSKTDLTKYFLPQLKKEPKCENINIPQDRSLPFRQGLPLTKLNRLFYKCHSSIRKIEKNEEYAFADFSKILFLKLLEEKWDSEGGEDFPYTYRFHELANFSKDRADQVKTAINSMIETIIKSTKFGEVLADPIKLKKDATYLTIVKRLSAVSFIDCQLDTKGAAFEYFVRATLKGKKLGQYFTPRPLVKLMLFLGDYQQILSNLKAKIPFKVLDPACGTGGFLVFAMNYCLNEVEESFKKKEIHSSLMEELTRSLKEDVFYGIDAHEGVASSAKMNMIIAGDGHNNIRHLDTLKEKKLIPNYKNGEKTCKDGKAHLILTNPPFGTSEGESLSNSDMQDYEIPSTKGQALFIQKMIFSVHPESKIVTVIDDGVLNTATFKEVRDLMLKECRLEKVISLPEETFKPNKINVKSSVLVLKKRQERDEDLADTYPIMFIKINSLGYEGSGTEMRGFVLNKLIKEVVQIEPTELSEQESKEGYYWSGFKVSSSLISADETNRVDLKYWDFSTREKTENVKKEDGWMDLQEINELETKRGNSPPAGEYVNETEGFALVVKAGTNISKKGELLTKGDYLEEVYFKEHYEEEQILKEGDILLSSTGDGTLGKCCVYRNKGEDGKTKPAIADGHVTLIRLKTKYKKTIYPEYVCDYLRKGFGAEQIQCFYTGSTGLIEIQPDEVKRIVIPKTPSIKKQRRLSKRLRKTEEKTESIIKLSIKTLNEEEVNFYKKTLFG